MLGYIAITLTVWGAIALVWWTWSRGRRTSDLRRIRARLGSGAEAKSRQARHGPALIDSEDNAAVFMVARLLQRLEWQARLQALVDQAGLKWNAMRTVHASMALFLGGVSACLYLVRLPAPAVLGVGLALGALPFLYVLRKRKIRLRKFEEQFPEALEFLSRAMRAGHAFSVSLEMIHTEFREPLAGEFRRTFDEQHLGLALDQALMKMGERIPLLDVQFFISAVTLQKRTGGNLAEILDKLASLIRERFKLRGRIRAISAHGRMTGAVLSSIPVAVGLLMWWVNPDYARFFFTDPTGQTMLGGTVTLQLIGYGIIRKIVSIEV
jgi:tight adherence protein B